MARNILFFLALATPTLAQEPIPPVPEVPREATTATHILADPVEPLRHPNIKASLDLGFPSALRVQVRPWEPPVWLEGSVGAYAPWPFYRAGVRMDGNLFEGKNNALQIRPALGMAYFPEVRTVRRHGMSGWLDGIFDHEQSWVLTADVEFTWRHRWWRQFHTDFGITLGLGYNLNSCSHRDWLTILPHVALTFGFQF